jgi:hypothetical protein
MWPEGLSMSEGSFTTEPLLRPTMQCQLHPKIDRDLAAAQ